MLQELLDHAELGTTKICTQGLRQGWQGVSSPLDDLPARRPGSEVHGPQDPQGKAEGGRVGRALPPGDQTVPRASRGPRRSLAVYTPSYLCPRDRGTIAW